MTPDGMPYTYDLNRRSRQVPSWVVRDHVITFDRPIVVGIVNVTPDSFSDGGALPDDDAAVAHAARLVEEGADILDVGGESTRPGSAPVSAGEELRRILNVIRELTARWPHIPLSVDTTKSEVARAALDAGARIVNDVSGLRFDDDMAALCAATGAGLVLVHSRGGPGELASYDRADYRNLIPDVIGDLYDRAAAASAAGVEDERIVLDPGIGFSKRSEHSLAVLAGLEGLRGLRFPLLVGVSRKRVIGELSGRTVPAERVAGTIAANVVALERGASLFRVHDVRAHREALDVAWAIVQAGPSRLDGWILREAGAE